MDFLEINQHKCRICLKKPAVLNWNEEIMDLCGTTYKYCYFQYTQLKNYVSDPFSQMLCETCSCDLKKCHFLIQTAIESYNILQTYGTFSQRTSTEEKIDVKERLHDDGEFETVFFEKPNEYVNNPEDNDISFSIKVNTSLEISKDFENDTVQKKSKTEEITFCKDLKKVLNYNKSKLKKVRNDKKCKDYKIKVKKHNSPENSKEVMDIPSPSNCETAEDKEINGSESKKTRRIMCAYCPRLIVAQYMKRHEETHQDRDREVACPKCGIKYFNKRSLYAHMFIHKENREKKHKCDFCDKAYYDRGALNIHRRIHLGQMLPCPICPKEFFRQVDLDKHKARTHGAAGLGKKNEKRTYYFVECQECGKNVPSHSWKDHQLRHSNKMQMKCTLCDKHFGSKRSCHSHVRRFHKYTDNFDKVVLYYGDDVSKRYSIIMLKQTEVVKPTFDDKS